MNKREIDILNKCVDTLILMSDRLDTVFKAVESIQKSIVKKKINIPIIQCKFSMRTYRALCSNGVKYLDELKNMTDIELYKWKNVGRITVKEIRETIKLLEE